MVINSLELKNYRNYDTFLINFCPGINFIYGKNGQGKTNLIESLYFITHLKSFRTSRIKELSSFSKDSSVICSNLSKQEVKHDVRITLQNNLKKVALDQKQVKFTSEYIKNFFSILFSPDQLTFFKEYPLERRNFFDRVLLLLNQNYFKKIKDFNRIKKQKSSLLRQGNAKDVGIWNQMLASLIPQIAKYRRDLVKKIDQLLPDIFSQLTGRNEKLEVWFKSDLENVCGENEVEIFSFLQKKLDTELAKRFLCYGPHKDGYWMTMDGNKDKHIFSQGEYRISFIALQLAINDIISEELGFNPVILLDDIFSELDQDVYHKTIEYINQKKNQVFITSTCIPFEFEEMGESFQISRGSLVYDA